jgi:hypothetical protein
MPFQYSLLDEVYGNSWTTNLPISDSTSESDQEQDELRMKHSSKQRSVHKEKHRLTNPYAKKPNYVKNPAVEDTYQGISYGTQFNAQLKPLDYSSTKSTMKKVRFQPEEDIETMSVQSTDTSKSLLSSSPYDISDPECVKSFQHFIHCKRCKDFMKYKMHLWMKDHQTNGHVTQSNKMPITEGFGNRLVGQQQSRPESIIIYILFGCMLLVGFDWYRKMGSGRL